MVDVSAKPTTVREAVARGEVRMRPKTLELIRKNQMAAPIMTTRSTSARSFIGYKVPPNGLRITGERPSEARERVRCMRVSGRAVKARLWWRFLR